jgi:6-phospho-beta-glucosidase
MARAKIAYIGGGSTRAPGTMSSFLDRGADFVGSEIVLVDLDADRLALVRRLSERMADARNVDVTISATTDRRAALEDCDVVLMSFRPGGFEARVLDERIPLRHGVIGQETQGPGGFFMALRSIAVFQEIASEIEAVCPRAWVCNYTNPVNIVAEAMTRNTAIPTVSLCEGPIVFPRRLARRAGLDPDGLEATMIGLNHASWSVRHTYDGEDATRLLESAFELTKDDPATAPDDRRLLELAAVMGSIPAEYLKYYYFEAEILDELRQRPTTRAEDILAEVPGYWEHYESRARAPEPSLDPARSRRGIDELELAVDVIAAVLNDRDEVHPVNVPNRGALPAFPDELVVEVPGRVTGSGVEPLPQPPLPRHVVGLVEMLAEHQILTADAAWRGSRKDAVRALACNPLVRSLRKAQAIYEDMSAAHSDWLPTRLVA